MCFFLTCVLLLPLGACVGSSINEDIFTVPICGLLLGSGVGAADFYDLVFNQKHSHFIGF
jgi:hypothetical protein